MGKKTTPEDMTATKFEAIRELLFGEDKQQYDHQLESVDKKHLEIDDRLNHLDALVESSNRSLEKAINDTKQEISAKMDRNHKELMAEIASLKKTKMDKESLSALFTLLSKEVLK